jgi:hypothetical protein
MALESVMYTTNIYISETLSRGAGRLTRDYT